MVKIWGMRVKRVTRAYFPRVTLRSRIRRKPRSHFLARRSVSRIHLQLAARSLTDWPPYFMGACRILTNELGLPQGQARSIVLESVSAAHECVRAQTEELHHTEVLRIRVAIDDACRRIANCKPLQSRMAHSGMPSVSPLDLP